ncbi:MULTISPECIES: cupredoxin domain-containing protein [Ornithinibacillus]|uniref:cupredoxin domain-containing protein n=1 Tax=Ornithinibacillus TaxID=484508 RepID=UPI00064DCEA2|nr:MULTISPECIES: cupredoxin domain-containing protein [Ornithinibacillus]
MNKGLLALITIGLVLVLAACGQTNSSDTDNSNSSHTGEATSNNVVEIKATNWEFDQAEYSVNAGEEVSISLTNNEGMHGIAIDEFDVNIEGDGKASFTPDQPGEYIIYCSIPCGEGHSEMKSTLIVK